MDPLFVVEKLNPDLIQKIPKLRKALQLRKQAAEVAKYLVSCRIAVHNIKEEDYKECIIKVNRKNFIRGGSKKITNFYNTWNRRCYIHINYILL